MVICANGLMVKWWMGQSVMKLTLTDTLFFWFHVRCPSAVRPSVYMVAYQGGPIGPTQRSEACSERRNEMRGCKLHMTQTKSRTQHELNPLPSTQQQLRRRYAKNKHMSNAKIRALNVDIHSNKICTRIKRALRARNSLLNYITGLYYRIILRGNITA